MSDDDLIAAFVASFQSDQFFTHDEPPPDELSTGVDPEDWNCIRWKPTRIETPKAELKLLYGGLGGRFPPLYEQLVLTWRWLDVWLDKIRLFANPPGPTLNPLAKQMHRDPVFDEHLVSNGYFPFGFDIDNYNPVCFDTTRSHPDGDCIIRKFEHESMLTTDRIGESWVIWSSCRAMMMESLA